MHDGTVATLSWAEVASVRPDGFEPRDRLSNHAPLHFDLVDPRLFLKRRRTAQLLVIIPEEYTKLPASAFETEADESARRMFYSDAVRSLIHLLLKGACSRKPRLEARLRWVLFGGEPFPTKHLRSIDGGATSGMVLQRLWSDRGQWLHLLHHPGGSRRLRRCPYPSDVLTTMSRRLSSMPGIEVSEGEVGELLIRAPTMMRGYLGESPELSERAFPSSHAVRSVR